MPLLGTIAGASARGFGLTSGAPPNYSLAATITTSQNWTVPSGARRIAVFLVGGGGSASDGGDSSYGLSGAGGAGGAGSAGIAFKDYGVNAGDVFSVTVGGANNPSTFGSLANSGYGNAGTPVSGTCSVAGFVSAAGTNGAAGGTARGGTGNGNPGADSNSANPMTLNLGATLGNVTINAGTSGAGGGGGACSIGTSSTTFSGGSGGNGLSGGGAGGSARASTPFASNGSNSTTNASNYGNGAHGGGGGGFAENTFNFIDAYGFGGSADSAASGGVVYVYTSNT
jgi:hypothetical protein